MIEHSKEELITMRLDDLETYVAPDGSIIRELPEFPAGGLSHCTLPIGMLSQAVKHQTIEEVWYCISGYGEFWRVFDYKEPVVIDIKSGTSLNIPCGAMFQFRNNGKWNDKQKSSFIYTLSKFSVSMFGLGSLLILTSFILFSITHHQGPIKTRRAGRLNKAKKPWILYRRCLSN